MREIPRCNAATEQGDRRWVKRLGARCYAGFLARSTPSAAARDFILENVPPLPLSHLGCSDGPAGRPWDRRGVTLRRALAVLVVWICVTYITLVGFSLQRVVHIERGRRVSGILPRAESSMRCPCQLSHRST